MLDNGATRQQVADVIGVGLKTIYKYLPAVPSKPDSERSYVEYRSRESVIIDVR
ncbi:hypothetical protein SB02110_03129 [Klebsiella quasipneumoniae subsp. quasipneumoniae]|nr:hypothetical protein SB02110_03129 [Klebsiella quasipneumoniae subsp. quasipneumoniae]